MQVVIYTLIGIFFGFVLWMIFTVLYQDYHDPSSPGYHFGRKD